MTTGPSAVTVEEALARHPHLAVPRTSPGALRVDCHLHTMWSGDSTTTPDELAAAILATGIDVVCITDHATIAGALALENELPCRVVVGQEQLTPEGELIGLFLSERIAAGHRSAAGAARAIREQGGIVYVPHPFDPTRHAIREVVLEALAAEGLVDVIEVLNAKTAFRSVEASAAADAAGDAEVEAAAAAAAAAARLGLAAGAGSDAHVPEAVGAAYVEMGTFEGGAEFLEAVRCGMVVGHHYDSARPWRARVVPSTKRP